jgi:hypothetical protein
VIVTHTASAKVSDASGGDDEVSLRSLLDVCCVFELYVGGVQQHSDAQDRRSRLRGTLAKSQHVGNQHLSR